MSLVDVKVPDIGDFAEVSVIELLVKPGDTIKAEQSLVTVESDKASMEIPSTHAGVVKELKVKLGDKVKEGSVLLVLESAGAESAGASAACTRSTARCPCRHPNPPPRRERARRSPLRLRPPTPAAPTSNATCWSWAPGRAAIRPRSARPTSA